MRALAAGVCMTVLLLSGCTNSLYRWGNYDDKLYNHYKHPDQPDRYMNDLYAIISDCNKHKTKVPPGICAEYGYCQYQKKEYALATSFFSLEKANYPESAFLMDRMIANVQSMSEGAK